MCVRVVKGYGTGSGSDGAPSKAPSPQAPGRNRRRKPFNFCRHGRARLGRGRVTQPKVVGERQLAPGEEELQQRGRLAVVVEGRVEAPGDLGVHHHLREEVVDQSVIRVTYRETSLVEVE